MKKCSNCKSRCYESWSGIDMCGIYEMAESEQEEIEAAKTCDKYEEGTPDCMNGNDYYSSATNGDYSPSNPWDAPGMSIKDFI